jgi:hypothetical protein
MTEINYMFFIYRTLAKHVHMCNCSIHKIANIVKIDTHCTSDKLLTILLA